MGILGRDEERAQQERRVYDAEAGVAGIKPGEGTREYDPEDMFPRLRASDNHGHSAVLGCRVHPRLDSVVQAIVDRKLFPIRSKSDFVAMAVYRFIQEVSELDPSVPSIFGQMGGITTLVDTMAAAEEFDRQLTRAVEQIEALVARGMRKLAAKHAGRFMAEVHGMPEGDWKEQWKRGALARIEKALGDDAKK